MRSEVVGFRSISGDHSGENLGRYFVGVCDRVGIMGKDQSKVQANEHEPSIDMAMLISSPGSCSLSLLITCQVTQQSAKQSKTYTNDKSSPSGQQMKDSYRKFRLSSVVLFDDPLTALQMPCSRRQPHKY
jgi:hypothetical protein